MASQPEFVEYLCQQAAGAGTVTSKKMFGEYALYLDDRLVALVCDDALFVKPTSEGRALLATVDEQPPYPGAKPHLRIGAEIDDRDLMQRLFTATARALPPQKPRPVRKPVAADSSTASRGRR